MKQKKSHLWEASFCLDIRFISEKLCSSASNSRFQDQTLDAVFQPFNKEMLFSVLSVVFLEAFIRFQPSKPASGGH